MVFKYRISGSRRQCCMKKGRQIGRIKIVPPYCLELACKMKDKGGGNKPKPNPKPSPFLELKRYK